MTPTNKEAPMMPTNKEAPMTPASQSIKPDHILHELSELWKNFSEHPKDDSAPKEGAGVLRACAMTLIVFVDDEDDSMALGETLARLMREHPSRAIVVRLRSDADTLQSRVFTQCWMPFGHSRQICCEQVELSVSLNRMADLPSIVAPLAAPDVPRVVWFRSSRIEGVPDIGDLLALGDKMIVDSTRPGAPTFADLRVLANAGYIVGDLAWTRLTKLRQLLAQLLDGRDLKDVRQVTIEYSGSDAPAAARYIQAWLRSSLEGAAVDLHRAESGETGKLSAIQVDADIRVRVEANCAEYQTGTLQERANLPACTENDLLSEELNIMTHDKIFERALQRMTVWTPRS